MRRLNDVEGRVRDRMWGSMRVRVTDRVRGIVWDRVWGHVRVRVAGRVGAIDATAR